MRNREEKEYYAYLEKVIREQKSSTPFFHKGGEDYEMDVLMLMNHIAKKNPHLAEKVIGNIVDTTGMKNASKQDILRFMGRTEKGTIVKWKNGEGEELYLVNNGTNLIKNSKRILVLGSHLNKGDMELLKKSMYGSVLKKDIQHVYDKMVRDEQQRKQRRGKFDVSNYFNEKRERKVEHTASLFEKNFKKLVREYGSSSSPFATASTMISLMDGQEKKKLSESLLTHGVRDSLDFERLLSKWKNEALHPEYVVERTQTKTIKKHDIEIERGF